MSYESTHDTRTKSKRLAGDDAARAFRLYEEILGRAAELGAIVARTLAIDAPIPAGFTLQVSGAGTKDEEKEKDGGTFIYNASGDLEVAGCYTVVDGVGRCCPGPCPPCP